MSPYLLALLSAFSFALGTVLQQRGTLQTAAQEGDPRFLAEIIRKPVWLLGGSLQVCGWVFQALALDRGSFVVVQSLCALSLVFALPLGVRLTGQHVGRRSILGAFATLLGIVLFVAVGQPQGGSSLPENSAWLASGLFITALVLLLAWLARRRRGTLAATLFATAAGLGFAYQAAVTKLFMTQIGYGLAAILTTWTTYALILSALAGFAFQQSALKTGYLAPAMAASNASTLIMSVILGLTLFQESLARGQGQLLPAILGLLLAIFGVMILSAPETGEVKAAPG
jgi:drug/metabolite transporter (DMT)-like permease